MLLTEQANWLITYKSQETETAYDCWFETDERVFVFSTQDGFGEGGKKIVLVVPISSVESIRKRMA